MKCQNCGENEANIKYTQIINGMKKQMSLCDKCAKELGIEDINFNMPISFSSFLGDVFNKIYEETIPSFVKSETSKCNKCNTTYEEFLKTGMFGCENCYEAFKIQIDSILKNIQGTYKHVGRISEHCMEKEYSNKDIKGNKIISNKDKNINIKLEELKEKLRREIAEEKYEDAAKTRDEIKMIKQKEGKE